LPSFPQSCRAHASIPPSEAEVSQLQPLHVAKETGIMRNNGKGTLWFANQQFGQNTLHFKAVYAELHNFMSWAYCKMFLVNAECCTR
jgi:hypothetical protein